MSTSVTMPTGPGRMISRMTVHPHVSALRQPQEFTQLPLTLIDGLNVPPTSDEVCHVPALQRAAHGRTVVGQGAIAQPDRAAMVYHARCSALDFLIGSRAAISSSVRPEHDQS